MSSGDPARRPRSPLPPTSEPPTIGPSREFAPATLLASVLAATPDAVTVKDGDGTILGVVATTRDETERHAAEAALRTSEAHSRLIFRDSPLPMWVFDVETLAVRAVNEAALRRYGYTREEFLALTILDLRPCEERPRMLGAVRPASPPEVVSRGHFVHCAKDGAPFHVEITSQDTVFDGRPARIVLAADVTDRHRAGEERERLLAAERVARERTERLLALSAAVAQTTDVAAAAGAMVDAGRAALGAAAGGLFLLAGDGTAGDGTAGAPPACVAALGLPPGTGADFADLADAADGPPRGPTAEVVRTGTAVVLRSPEELARRHPALAAAWDRRRVHALLVLPLVVAGRVIGTVGYAFDAPRTISDDELAFATAAAQQTSLALERIRLFDAERAARTEAEAARAVAERETRRVARLQALTAAVAVPLTRAAVSHVVLAQALDAGGAVAGALHELSADGRELVLLDAMGYDDTVRRRIARMSMRGAGPAQRVARARRPEYLRSLAEWLGHGASPTPDGPATGPPRGVAALPLVADERMLGVLTLSFAQPHAVAGDERAFLEAFAQQCAQAIARASAYEAERVARAEAEHASRAKGEFLANMSHELRTPLNAIAGHVQLVEMGLHGPVTPAQGEALGRVQAAGRHLLGLINDVLNYAKLEAGRVEYDLREVDLGEVVEATAALIAPQRLAKGQRWTLRLPEAPEARPVVWADRDKVGQVVLNLLSNAVKFTPEGGAITADVSAAGGAPDLVAVHIADTGIGIPADRTEAIFEPFVQVNATRARQHEGTGLGLTISRDLARGMGGDLTVTTTEGEGSTFHLLLRRVVTTEGDRTDRRFHDVRRAAGAERRDDGEVHDGAP